ncbi:MAG: hypothetical protein ACOYET_04650, partial [Bacillota bacterium]
MRTLSLARQNLAVYVVANWQLRGSSPNSCLLPLIRNLRYNIPEVSSMPTRAKRLEALYNCGLMVGQ